MEFTEYVRSTDRRFFYYGISVILTIQAFTVIGLLIAEHHWVLNMYATYILVANTLSGYRTTTLEPGILPQRAVPTFNLNQIDLKGGVSIIPDVLRNLRVISFTTSTLQSDYTQKYCHSCNIFRPAKASHCTDCGYCVLAKDHHCVWMNNCIGRNNHGLFYSFVTTLLILSFYDIYSLYKIKEIYSNMAVYGMCMGLMFILGLLTAILFVFWAYHGFIWIFNITSREFIASGGRVPLRLDFNGIIKRLLTIRPVILYNKAGI